MQATSRLSQRSASLVTPKCMASSPPHTHLTPHSHLPTRPHLLTQRHPPTLPQHHLPCHTPLQSPPRLTPLQCPPRHTPCPAASDRVPLQHQGPPPTLLDSTCRVHHLKIKARAAHSKGHPASMAQASIHSLVSSTVSSTVSSSILQQAHMALL